jgi:cell pole-organizing protein PopZ
VAEEDLLSPSTQNQVANMLGQLNQGVAPAAADEQPGQMGTSVEDLVRQMLKPMLQNWLDEHLPQMVERMVEREIQRVTRGR